MIPHATHYTKPSVCNVELKHMSSLTKKTHPTLATAIHASSSTGLLCSWEGGAQNSTHPNCPNEEGAKALSSERYQ